MNNVVKLKTRLMEEPMDYQFSRILQNMIATCGQEKVTEFFLEVFYQEFKKREATKQSKQTLKDKKEKVASNEN